MQVATLCAGASERHCYRGGGGVCVCEWKHLGWWHGMRGELVKARLGASCFGLAYPLRADEGKWWSLWCVSCVRLGIRVHCGSSSARANAVGSSRNMNARGGRRTRRTQFQGPRRSAERGVARRVRVCVTGRVFRRRQPRGQSSASVEEELEKIRGGQESSSPSIDKAMMVKGLTRFGNCDEKTKGF